MKGKEENVPLALAATAPLLLIKEMVSAVLWGGNAGFLRQSKARGGFCCRQTNDTAADVDLHG